MKAVLMAGGEGSRLRPLTCGIPKPMVPVANRPVMEHILDLLARHGFREVAVTLQYLPEAIREHFGTGGRGLRLTYFTETEPMGTAGGVKNAAPFLDETFLVISGDALTDLDLGRAVAFHRERGAWATLVLARVDCPVEYGVVITAPDGRIRQFLEKPGWGEIFSDTVNTGIYVLEPRVLDYVPADRPFDFSKDLFPRLLAEGRPLYGVVLEGYWCDIGDLHQYLEAHRAVLEGRVKVDLAHREVAPGVWAGEGVEVHPEAVLRGPVLLGRGCVVARGAVLEPYTVVGPGSRIAARATVKRSVLWEGSRVGQGAALRGVVLGRGVEVRAGAHLYEGTVVGDDSVIGEGALVKPDVKIWPGKLVEAGSVVDRSIVWGTRAPRRLFGSEGIAGEANADLTPEGAVRVAVAFGALLGAGRRVAVSGDADPFSRLLTSACACGLRSAGARVVDLGVAIVPVHRFGVRALGCAGGIHVRRDGRRPGRYVMVFTDGRGIEVNRDLQRKVEAALARGDVRPAAPDELHEVEPAPWVVGGYLRAVVRGTAPHGPGDGPGYLVLAYDPATLGTLVPQLVRELGLTAEHVPVDPAGAGPDAAVPEVARRVTETRALAGAVIGAGGEELVLVDEEGRVVAGDTLLALLALVSLRLWGGPLVVPVTAPAALEALARAHGSRVVRTKTPRAEWLGRLLAEYGADGESWPRAFLYCDAPAALAATVGVMRREDATLGRLAAQLPPLYRRHESVPVSWEARGRVLRELAERPVPHGMELVEGVKIYYPEGWALVLPDPEEPVCRVYADATSWEVAEALTERCLASIREILDA
ncbi:MAG: NTP transferase domain-containing protein [Firmicutes bacterium]|nr:NTP transferase domain-containing protein [Bacillota bacterium]